MHSPAQNQTPDARLEDDYITIVAPTLDEVMQQFRDSGLAAKGYAIAGRVARHRFDVAGVDPFGGAPMSAATFIRNGR